jgi:hypothetical protein
MNFPRRAQPVAELQTHGRPDSADVPRRSGKAHSQGEGSQKPGTQSHQVFGFAKSKVYRFGMGTKDLKNLKLGNLKLGNLKILIYSLKISNFLISNFK